MLQIVESVCQGAIRLLPDPACSGKFKTGLIVQLIDIDGTPRCTLSDGTKPFGIIGESIDTQPYGLIPVWFESMILRTDVFEKRITYEMGDSLYVNKKSMLTTKKPFEDAYPIGHVITGPSHGKNYLEMNWI